ncbi:MAG: hypothetical protein QOC85_3675 [Streptomyces sp.]|nr:hypothetical protein [Streptomyces sp.]
MNVEEALTTTRAVRRRLDLARPVGLDVIRACLDTALQAPAGGDRQQWVVVTDRALRRKVGSIYRRCFEQRYPGVVDRRSDEPTTPLERSAGHLALHKEDVPVHVIPCLELRDGNLPAGSQASAWAGLLPAVWSYMLAARSRGLGTAWTTTHLMAEEEVADLLGIPQGVRQAALIPTAYTLGTEFSPARRSPLDGVLHLNGWHRREGG